jgi:hypothetical protein
MIKWRDRDERGQGQAQRLGSDLGPVAGDHAVGLEAAHPGLDGRDRQTAGLGEIFESGATVGDQRCGDEPIGRVVEHAARLPIVEFSARHAGRKLHNRV